MAALSRAVADNLTAHVAAVSGEDDAARYERRAYGALAENYGDAARVLTSIADEMESQRDMPAADHDVGLLSSEDMMSAIEAMADAEDELASLLRDLAAEHRAVLRELAGGAS
jgi:uncharacterized protein YukE